MEEPDPDQNGPSPEEVQNAVDFFVKAGEDETVESLAKNNWNPHLVILEENLNSNEDDRGKEFGLSASQIGQILDALIAWTDREFRNEYEESQNSLIRPRRKRTKQAKGNASQTAFGLPKRASGRLLSCLVPNEPLSGSMVRKFVLHVLTNIEHYDDNSFILPVLRWTNCLLHYSLCPPEELISIYEVFVMSCSLPSLVPLICDIMYKLTDDRTCTVTRWRANFLLNVQSLRGKTQSLENLLRKYKDLKPALIPQPFPAINFVEPTNKSTTEQHFAQLWSNGDPLAANFEEAIENAMSEKLRIWGAPGPTYVLANQTNKRKRLCAVPPVEDEPVFGKKKKECLKGIPLNRCKTKKELIENLPNIRLPAQMLSLLGMPQTFCLLFLNSKSVKVQERFSLTLYRTLYTEFFSLSCAQGCTKRKLDLLCRINTLQERLQESIPVVERFLVEYLQVWNGTDFFIEILRLLNFIRITDFDEFNDCVLAKIRIHFNHSYNISQQLMVLTYLNRLCFHWIQIEFPRVKGETTYSFFTSASSNSFCENPLESIAGLVKTLQNYSELGLAKLTYFSTSTMTQAQKQFYQHFFVKEIISMFMLLSRCLINQNIPIRPELPPSIVYYSIFSSSLCYLATSLEFLATNKHELIPLCKRRAEEFQRDMNFAARKVALAQVADLSPLNDISKDVLATLSSSQVYLERNCSIYRRHWEVEDEEIRNNLNIISHPALFPLMIRFIDTQLKSQSSRSKGRRNVLFNQLTDEGSDLHQRYVDYLKLHLPLLVDSLDTFQWRMKQITCHGRDDASMQSATTSGVSSVKPSKSRLTRLRKKT